MIVLLVLIVIFSMCILLHLESSAAQIQALCVVNKYIIYGYDMYLCVRLYGCGETDNSNMFIVCTSVCVCVWSAWVTLNNTPPSLHLNVFTLTLSTTTTIVQLCFKTQNHKSIFL